MNLSRPPIKEPLLSNGNILSSIWIRWFMSLFDFIQIGGADTTSTNMQGSPTSSSTIVNSKDALLQFIPKSLDQKTVEIDAANMQTLYWMGV